jgi:arylsulfatase A-like enzyme
MLEEPENITEDELETLIDLYDGEIRYMDDEVGRLVQTVRDRWDGDPAVVFTSDHGDEFLDHGQFSHLKTLYDELIHVPLLVHDGDGSETYDDIVELVDLPPTLLTMAGVDADIPATYEGEPLQHITGGGTRERTYAICDAGDTLSYRDDRWKCIQRPDSVELYDIRDDPGETDDIGDRNQDIVADLTSVLDEHREKSARTDEDLEAVEIGGEVQDRLEQLGYLQE